MKEKFAAVYTYSTCAGSVSVAILADIHTQAVTSSVGFLWLCSRLLPMDVTIPFWYDVMWKQSQYLYLCPITYISHFHVFYTHS
jgi:hypothetical protein